MRFAKMWCKELDKHELTGEKAQNPVGIFGDELKFYDMVFQRIYFLDGITKAGDKKSAKNRAVEMEEKSCDT